MQRADFYRGLVLKLGTVLLIFRSISLQSDVAGFMVTQGIAFCRKNIQEHALYYFDPGWLCK